MLNNFVIEDSINSKLKIESRLGHVYLTFIEKPSMSSK
jgi:hypothetical protein